MEILITVPCEFLSATVTVTLILPFKCNSASRADCIVCAVLVGPRFCYLHCNQARIQVYAVAIVLAQAEEQPDPVRSSVAGTIL